MEFPTTTAFTGRMTKHESEGFVKVLINEKLDLCDCSKYKLMMEETPIEVYGPTRRIIYSGAIKSNVRLSFKGEANTEYRTMSCSEIIRTMIQTSAVPQLKGFFTEISVSILTNLMHKGMLTNGYWDKKL